MIYDAFMFFNELDLLEIRLNVLGDIVDKFVLVECGMTHQGEKKPFFFDENKDRYAAFADKIIHHKMPGEDLHSSWLNENAQRRAIKGVLPESISGDDILIISDVDEIPNPCAVLEASRSDLPASFGMQLYYYYLNTAGFYPNQGWARNWNFAKIFRFRDVVDTQDDRFRKCRDIGDAGWHWSFLGGSAKIKTKLKSFAHVEFSGSEFTNDEHIDNSIKQLVDPFGRGTEFRKVAIDESFPKYVRDNQDKYRHIILE